MWYSRFVWFLNSFVTLRWYLQYDFLVREKIADGALISKWRKPGYEILCSLLAIQKGNHNFGTTSHCRVPMRKRAPQQKVTPDVQTGCICCASGDGRFGGPIWWNTPVDDDNDQDKNKSEKKEENRAVWVQEGDEEEEAEEDTLKRKRGEEEEEDLDPDVLARLNALKKSM